MHFTRGRKISPTQILQQVQIGYADSPRWQTENLILRFKSDFFVDLVTPLLTIDSWHLCLWNFTKISLMWLHSINGMTIVVWLHCFPENYFNFMHLRYGHIYCCAAKFRWQITWFFYRNLCDREFHASAKKFPKQILLMFKLVTWIRHADQQKTALFESEYCVSCALYIATLLTKGLFLPIYAKLRYNFAFPECDHAYTVG